MFNIEYFQNKVYLYKPNRLKENFIKNNFNDFYQFIEDKYSGDCFLEKLYVFVNGHHRCYCGSKTKFISFKKGYLEYCSISCSSNSDKTRKKYKDTCLLKYGVDNVSRVDDVKLKKKNSFYEKYGTSTYLISDIAKNRMLDKYGVDNPFKLNYIQDKIKSTNLEKYGVECVLKTDMVKEKTKRTNLEKYGVDHFSKTDDWKSIVKKTNNESYIDSLSLPKSYIFISKEGYTNKLNHIDCGNTFNIQTQLIRLRINKGLEICKHCNSIFFHSENSLFDYIRSVYSGDIRKYRDRKYEIDIYLPELKLGFEFNGLYWHSELFKESDYHLRKMEYFKENGIRIVNIWEDDWNNKPDIIKSIINSIIGKLENRLFARRCKISKISNNECKDFLNKNHIQGWCVSKYRYALIYNNEIVSVLTVGSRRINLGYRTKKSDSEFELIRFCNRLNTSVVGGFSKLLKSAIDDIGLTKIITYSDISMFTGDTYTKSGFKFIGNSSPGYHYIVNGVRKNRFNYNKSKLIKMGFDKDKTEREIMFENKYYRIYDCGNSKFEFNIY